MRKLRSTLSKFKRCSATLPIAAALLLAASTGCDQAIQPAATPVAHTPPRPKPIDRSGPLSLSTEFFPIPEEASLMRNPLTRELGRQAVLIAARDGLGLPTRLEGPRI
jgi:hypothetical protein